MRVQAGRFGGNIGKQLKDYQNQQEKQKNSSASSRKNTKRSSIISKEGAPPQDKKVEGDTDLRIFIATRESGQLGVSSKEAELFASRMGQSSEARAEASGPMLKKQEGLARMNRFDHIDKDISLLVKQQYRQ